MLLKPTGAIEHGGGVRFATGSLEYRVIAEWIAAGTPGPSATEPEIRALDAFTGRRPAGARPGAAGLGPGGLFRRTHRGRDALGQVHQHR